MIDSEFGVALINGFIGAGATAELVAVVKTAMKLPTFEDVCANPDKIDVPTKLDEAYAMIMLCAVRANFTQHGDAPMRYVTRFPPNLALTGIVSMARGDINFLNSGAMVGWVGQNQQLLGKFKNHILLAKGK